ncbi:helix-turn-helix domain-containing protein [Polaribacter batillariae]|uniref:Helix-turn-helix domain-containing protein n=1 Tax=Polaribacter batillariae TaxID=2808900 RepID=A0ABX7SVY1_9FLAO|nr:helix-turn-helix domain-containing protein [Polaribacter batillariae]QTD36283.1 helix-turn-helix domain-containing protein [Polaribacter batillariae]QTD36704.1 helix-turn-helix domain-containing protein [Polaribacter batillariae]QTD37003.1 helix-turn-helix domain-containing protein [Polaribacter batillariae]QTD37435.1 helix-turn-helix domain-containing protein [Polaribacter batillariae]QTD38616.1 helix-turn-helix domain-containing protein [Polaribacter batillariae]
MPKKITLSIKEESVELRKLYESTTTELRRDRLKMLYYIKSGKYIYRNAIAKKLGRRPTTIGNWIKDYETGGLSNLLEIHSGGNNTVHISDRAKAYISKTLSNSDTTITSYIELQAHIAEDLSEMINYGALYAHCRRKHKSKLKVSRKSHYKKDPKAEMVFKKPRKHF